MLQASIKAEGFVKKQNPYDRIKPLGTKVQKITDELRKMGLANENEHKFSKVNAHEVWLNEKKDRKI